MKLHFFASLISAAPVIGKNLTISLQDVTAKQVLLCLQKTYTCFLHFGDEVDWKLGRTLFDMVASKIYPCSELGEGVVISQFVICVMSGVFILIWNKDYMVLGNEHSVME